MFTVDRLTQLLAAAVSRVLSTFWNDFLSFIKNSFVRIIQKIPKTAGVRLENMLKIDGGNVIQVVNFYFWIGDFCVCIEARRKIRKDMHVIEPELLPEEYRTLRDTGTVNLTQSVNEKLQLKI